MAVAYASFLESNAAMSFWSTISKIFPLYLEDRSCWFAMYHSRFFLRGSGTRVEGFSPVFVSMTTESAYHTPLWLMSQVVCFQYCNPCHDSADFRKLHFA